MLYQFCSIKEPGWSTNYPSYLPEKKLLIVLKSIEYYLVKKFISNLCMKIFPYISICGAVLFKEINIHM